MRLVVDNARTELVLVLVELVALLHDLVVADLLLRLDDGRAADRARVAVVRPVQQAPDVENVIQVALERDNLVERLERGEANRALVAC